MIMVFLQRLFSKPNIRSKRASLEAERRCLMEQIRANPPVIDRERQRRVARRILESLGVRV